MVSLSLDLCIIMSINNIFHSIYIIYESLPKFSMVCSALLAKTLPSESPKNGAFVVYVYVPVLWRFSRTYRYSEASNTEEAFTSKAYRTPTLNTTKAVHYTHYLCTEKKKNGSTFYTTIAKAFRVSISYHASANGTQIWCSPWVFKRRISPIFQQRRTSILMCNIQSSTSILEKASCLCFLHV